MRSWPWIFFFKSQLEKPVLIYHNLSYLLLLEQFSCQMYHTFCTSIINSPYFGSCLAPKCSSFWMTNSCAAKKWILMSFKSWGFLHHHPSFCSDLQAVWCFLLLIWSMQSDNMLLQVVEIFQILTLEWWTTGSKPPNFGVQGFLLITFAQPGIDVRSILPFVNLRCSPRRSSLRPHPAGLGASLKQSLLTPASVSVPFLRMWNNNYKTQTGGIGGKVS